jgi:hypothetical protein
MINWLIHLLDNGSSVCDEWCLHLWEVVGIWLTGAATFAAVLVSLRLARREGIRITVTANVLTIVRPGQAPPFPEVVAIIVRNIGTRPAPIEAVAWRRRPWSNQYAYQVFDPATRMTRPPKTVEVAESVKFMLPLAGFGDGFLDDYVGRCPALGARLMRVLVWTPAGHQCSAFLQTSLQQWIVKKISLDRSQQQAGLNGG